MIVKKLKLKKIPSFQLIYMLIFLIFVPFIRFYFDNDFWFTINQGRYILQNGFPTKAINTIHNIDMIYQSWGSSVIYYLVYSNFYKYGVIFLLLIVSLLFSYFYYKLCMVISNNKRLSLWITLLTTFLYNLFFLVTRPHIFTSLNLVIILYLLESFIKTNKNKYLYLIPFIFLLQINMHGIYFILLLIIIFPYIINSFKFNIFKIKSLGYTKNKLIFVYLVSLLMGFINPYGYKTIIYGFKSYGVNVMNYFISELLPPSFGEIKGKIYIITIIITFILYFRKKNIPLRYYLLLLGTSYLALDSNKSFNLFIICSLFPLAYIYRDYKKNDVNLNYTKVYKFFHLGLTIALCFIIIINIPNNELINYKKFITYLNNNVTNKEKTKLYTNFYDGSYFEYMGFFCYIDPRAEVFLKSNNHKEDILEEYYNLEYLNINYDEFLKKYSFDYIFINKKEDILYYLMTKFNSYNYYIVLEDDNYCLYKLGEVNE